MPTAKPAKVPLFPPNTITSVKVALPAVANELVLKLAVPAIFNIPVIGIAWAERAKPTAIIIAARPAIRVLISFIFPECSFRAFSTHGR